MEAIVAGGAGVIPATSHRKAPPDMSTNTAKTFQFRTFQFRTFQFR
jgi:hypothetical protein